MKRVLLLAGAVVAEVALLAEAGGRLGAWPTVGLVLATGIAGTTLIRVQGLALLHRVLRAADGGAAPDVLRGAWVLAAGLLLLAPGFLTDALGLALFAPPARRLLARLLKARAARGVRTAAFADRPRGAVVDGEFEEIDPAPPARPGIDRDRD